MRSKARIRQTLAALAAGVVSLLGSGPAGATDARPQRIVSLNLCIDQILLDLVPRERIVGLSFLAGDPSMSLLHREAQGIRSVQGSAEEILTADPDLVLAGEFTTAATVDLLRRFGRRVEIIPMASSFKDIEDVVRRMGLITGEEERASRMVAEFEARLAAAKARSAFHAGSARPRAVAMQVSSIASGVGSLVDQVLQESGFENVARSARLGPGGRMSLEDLIADPPDVIVLAHAPEDFRTVLGDNLRHPAFKALQKERPSVHLPMSEWLCGTPRIVDAVEKLAAAREALRLRAEAAR